MDTLMIFEQFDAKNGNDGIRIGNYICFSNGAVREFSTMGVLSDPPPDDLQRCNRIVRYHEAYLEREVTQFDDFKQQLLNDNDAWADAVANEAKLKQLQAAVRSRQEKLAEAIKTRDQFDPQRRHAEPDRVEIATQRRRDAFWEKVDKIEV